MKHTHDALPLQDQHGNPAGVNMSGKVQIVITHDGAGGEVTGVPQLVGSTTRLELPLQRGQVTLQVRVCSSL